MTYTKLDLAKVAGNLANLGVPVATIKATAQDWAARRTALLLQTAPSGTALDPVQDDLGNDGFDRMFVCFRFSAYPYIFRALAERSSTRTITSLIGHQAQDHLAHTQQLACAFDFNIRFVQSGASMVRSMRAAITAGPGILFLDTPWSRTKTPLDVRYAAPGGHFNGLSTIARLVDAIDPRFEMISANRDGGTVTIRRHAVRNMADAFALVGEQIARDPADYEMLDRLHQSFDFAHPSAAMISFRIKDQRYAIHARTMRAWKLPSVPLLDLREADADGLCGDRHLLDWIGNLVGDRVDAIVCL